jgi:phosphoribosylaminoimidazole-succinocarboxamide synthase
MTLSSRDKQALAGVLTDAEFPELPQFERGKVRDSYNLPGGRRIMIATDRQSAFDKVLAAVPYKGQVLTQTARFWFDQTADIYPDPNVAVAKTLEILPIEMVVRDYITGSTDTSIWPMYNRGERLLYGQKFPEGLVKNQKLPETIITPTTKAAAGEHDAPITVSEIVEQGLLTQEQWDNVAAKSLAVFARGRDISARNGLILVDTKFEFGLDNKGEIILADEILTPDSSRYWRAESYAARLAAGEEPDSLDKEFLRLWVRGRCDPYTDPIPEIPPETLIEFAGKYIALFETVTGQSFDYGDPATAVRDRVQAALARTFPEYF